MKPLNFAILKLFVDGLEACAEEVCEALSDEYGGFRALNPREVLNALMTAESNALLEETRADFAEDGGLRLYFRASPESAATINRYIP